MSTANTSVAAEIAYAMSECMNLLFLFAAPRVYSTFRWSSPDPPQRETVEACLARFLETAEGIRARSDARSEDVERVVEVAAIIHEMQPTIAAMRFDEPLPVAIVESARQALLTLGFPPPEGGWDEFEGFVVRMPPQSAPVSKQVC